PNPIPNPMPAMPLPGVPTSWRAPGPIQPEAPATGLGAIPAPGGASKGPLDPSFPALDNGHAAQGWPAQPDPSSARGWPSASAAEPIQYTERVPAPPAARPLLSRPKLQAPDGAMDEPNAPSIAEPDPWAAQYMPALPAGGDDPDWR